MHDELADGSRSSQTPNRPSRLLLYGPQSNYRIRSPRSHPSPSAQPSLSVLPLSSGPSASRTLFSRGNDLSGIVFGLSGTHSAHTPDHLSSGWSNSPSGNRQSSAGTVLTRRSDDLSVLGRPLYPVKSPIRKPVASSIPRPPPERAKTSYTLENSLEAVPPSLKPGRPTLSLAIAKSPAYNPSGECPVTRPIRQSYVSSAENTSPSPQSQSDWYLTQAIDVAAFNPPRPVSHIVAQQSPHFAIRQPLLLPPRLESKSGNTNKRSALVERRSIGLSSEYSATSSIGYEPGLDLSNLDSAVQNWAPHIMTQVRPTDVIATVPGGMDAERSSSTEFGTVLPRAADSVESTAEDNGYVQTLSPVAEAQSESTLQAATVVATTSSLGVPPSHDSDPLADLTSTAVLPSSSPHPENSTIMREQNSELPARRQGAEIYDIRKINWLDSKSERGMRESPILMQSANGPCPLMALVNCLVLSSPPSPKIDLVEVLRTRESVSLGFLLDAVIEELIRRAETQQTSRPLPEMADLYSFLLGLHSGMLVNPRMLPAEPHLPGAFQNTAGVELYGAFGVPLYHGWIAPSDHPAYSVFEKSVPTFEDAQNLLSLKDELQGMNNRGEAEEMRLRDICSVEDYLRSTATQLTPNGIINLSEGLALGQFAILFRNDHFNTLYKQPLTGQLFTLVTDAGFAGHDEVVWTSIVDILEGDLEFFSGDFRPIGHEPPPARQSSSHQSSDPLTCTNRSESSPQAVPQNPEAPTPDPMASTITSIATSIPPSHPTRQQQHDPDHDMALAMHLQEEENRLHRSRQQQQRRQVQRDSQHAPSIPDRHQRGPGGGGGLRQPHQTGISPAQLPGQRTQHTVMSPVSDGAPPSYGEANGESLNRPFALPAVAEAQRGSAFLDRYGQLVHESPPLPQGGGFPLPRDNGTSLPSAAGTGRGASHTQRNAALPSIDTRAANGFLRSGPSVGETGSTSQSQAQAPLSGASGLRGQGTAHRALSRYYTGSGGQQAGMGTAPESGRGGKRGKCTIM